MPSRDTHSTLPTLDQPTHRSGGPLSRRTVLGGLAGSVAVVAAGRPAWAVDSPRPGATRGPSLATVDRRVVREVRPEQLLRHLRALSEDIGPRIGGTRSEYDAAQYVAAQLDRQRLAVRLEPFAVADKFLAQVDDPRGQLPDDVCWQAGASPDAALDVRVAGDAVDVGPAASPTWPDDVTGRVVLADDPQNATDPVARVAARAAFVADAESRGAVAVVLLPADLAFPRRAQASSPRLVPGTGSVPPPTTVAGIPVLGVAQVQKQLLREDLAVRPLRLELSTVAHRGLTSHNVIGERPAGRRGGTSPLVYVSAHYDTVIGAPGANDDGSGTALTLELARVLTKLGKLEAGVRFALWGSEEQGLIGSRHHVAQLAQPERDRIRGVFQNDMVGTSWSPATRYWQLSFDGQANPTTQSVTAAAERLGYALQISPVTQRGASDHQSFQEVGIASANFSWRGESSPALLEPPYHSPEDTIAKNISMDRLTVSTELIGCATYDLASRR
ncbi:M20/M25/M40 family metallo-hydrolase [Nocardioides sp. CFH 31398]|uniref:M20/M25/M40 family metallo-hydrolase n=1 Tax=Nocardioides sp. CFH 31398 TaxID=2919579 RepID=UPI001F069F58|nr:M20/M25/M40 family metallo-hydrolase [Nocardioides sp. CFH 31398]MCH1866729.1 M20/M25/M40 family metallo-hydrolase [Nocardioides sp. CFH 31398]